jgi:hypothetical protein
MTITHGEAFCGTSLDFRVGMLFSQAEFAAAIAASV